MLAKANLDVLIIEMGFGGTRGVEGRGGLACSDVCL